MRAKRVREKGSKKGRGSEIKRARRFKRESENSKKGRERGRESEDSKKRRGSEIE